MNTKSILSRSQYQDYLRYLTKSTSKDENYLVSRYFGPGSDYLANGIDRAYRDFSRTLHGIGKLPSKNELRNQATIGLKRVFTGLQCSTSRVTSPAIFDSWHRDTCEQLISTFDKYGHHLFVGQAQKWVNMTFKYIS
jgi:hypothetical protein